MIVASPAVAGNFGVLFPGGAIVGGVVVERHGDDGSDGGHELANVLTLGVGHPFHVGVVSCG